jgi:hypothetical protein
MENCKAYALVIQKNTDCPNIIHTTDPKEIYNEIKKEFTELSKYNESMRDDYPDYYEKWMVLFSRLVNCKDIREMVRILDTMRHKGMTTHYYELSILNCY